MGNLSDEQREELLNHLLPDLIDRLEDALHVIESLDDDPEQAELRQSLLALLGEIRPHLRPGAEE
ncbi:MAG: hypothetical protein GYB64_20455 [Chloroflexi bacterium]|nr:hypothetical protein [Chloroflexota bacterium]